MARSSLSSRLSKTVRKVTKNNDKNLTRRQNVQRFWCCSCTGMLLGQESTFAYRTLTPTKQSEHQSIGTQFNYCWPDSRSGGFSGCYMRFSSNGRNDHVIEYPISPILHLEVDWKKAGCFKELVKGWVRARMRASAIGRAQEE